MAIRKGYISFISKYFMADINCIHVVFVLYGLQICLC